RFERGLVAPRRGEVQGERVAVDRVADQERVFPVTLHDGEEWRKAAVPGQVEKRREDAPGLCGRDERLVLDQSAAPVAALPVRDGVEEERVGGQRPGLGLRRSRSEEHTSELQSRENLVCRLLLEKK